MKWALQKMMLEKERQEIMDRLQRNEAYGLDHTMNEEVGELSGYDNHPADMATEMYEREKDVTLRNLERFRLRDIENALQAIHSGSYGVCQRCGQPIPSERLEVSPQSLYCVACKDALEHRDDVRFRPVEEEYLAGGFARSNVDERDEVGYDGEDAWQDVARYNERSEFADDFELGAMDDNEGIVDVMDVISNEQYRQQLPD